MPIQSVWEPTSLPAREFLSQKSASAEQKLQMDHKWPFWTSGKFRKAKNDLSQRRFFEQSGPFCFWSKWCSDKHRKTTTTLVAFLCCPACGTKPSSKLKKRPKSATLNLNGKQKTEKTFPLFRKGGIVAKLLNWIERIQQKKRGSFLHSRPQNIVRLETKK